MMSEATAEPSDDPLNAKDQGYGGSRRNPLKEHFKSYLSGSLVFSVVKALS
jgi:hypothetical protein